MMIEQITSPLKAIRAFCIDCMGDQVRLVKECPTQTCPLHAFRMGKNPYRSRELTDEERQAIAERLQNAKKTS